MDHEMLEFEITDSRQALFQAWREAVAAKPVYGEDLEIKRLFQLLMFTFASEALTSWDAVAQLAEQVCKDCLSPEYATQTAPITTWFAALVQAARTANPVFVPSKEL